MRYISTLTLHYRNGKLTTANLLLKSGQTLPTLSLWLKKLSSSQSISWQRRNSKNGVFHFGLIKTGKGGKIEGEPKRASSRWRK